MVNSVIITGPGFQDEELIYPYYRLKEEGYQVDVLHTANMVCLHGLRCVPPTLMPTISI